MSQEGPLSHKKSVKFTLYARKKNVIASNSILGMGIDDATEDSIDPGKRKRHTLMENDELTGMKKESKSRSSLVIPVLMQNDWRIQRLQHLKDDGKPVGEKVNLELLTANTSAFPQIDELESSVDADYDSVPIEEFGLAVLRGCGWDEGEGIGKTNKRVVPLRISSNRPKGLGLGADVMVPTTAKKCEVVNDTSSGLKKSSVVRIISGMHRDSCGTVESLDEDNASIIVRLYSNGKNVRVSQYAVLQIAADKQEQESRNTALDIHLKEDDGNNLLLKEYKNYQCEFSSGQKYLWARPELKVRFIDKKYKNGELFNEKVRILNVAGKEDCTVQDFFGNTYHQINEDWLETVVPKIKGQKLMIVRGRHRGCTAMLEARIKKKCKVIARLISTDELVSISYDNVCEYLGSVDNP